jgi:hypothetical protein
MASGSRIREFDLLSRGKQQMLVKGTKAPDLTLPDQNKVIGMREGNI